MKYTFCLLLIILSFQSTNAQQKEIKFFSLELDYFYGSILEHNPEIAHLITGHPSGFILTYNRKTYGFNEWEGRYNHPDWGFTFTYQNLENPVLGENYGLYAHYNFYFLNRSLSFGFGQGIAYTTNPYDPDTNFNNNAFGTRILSSTHLKFNYVKENIYKGIGFHAGIGVIHYSNANFKAPNTSTNTFYFSTGLSYQFNYINFPELIPQDTWPSRNYAERIKYNAVFRMGINEADVNGLGQFPFYVLSAYADKRINYKSTFQVGAEIFFSNFLKDLILYRSTSFPEDGLTGDEDYKRVGVFIGHEFRVNRIAFLTQLGYYVYWPYHFEDQMYNRLGFKRYFGKEKVFAVISLKSHGAKAEGVEFGFGIRL